MMPDLGMVVFDANMPGAGKGFLQHRSEGMMPDPASLADADRQRVRAHVEGVLSAVERGELTATTGQVAWLRGVLAVLADQPGTGT